MSMMLALQAATSAATSTAASAQPDIGNAVSELTNFLLQYLTPLIAVGAFSMAFIELWKTLLDKRTKFQARRWMGWTEGNASAAGLVMTPDGPGEKALADLLQLCTGVSEPDAIATARDLIRRKGLPSWFSRRRAPAHAVFALELARMMGSIQEAADTVMANPGHYQNLYRLFTAGAKPEDIKAWLDHGPDALTQAVNIESAEQRKRIKEQSELVARLRQVIKGKLDGFQLYTNDSWINHNQLAANLVGIVVMLGSLMFNHFEMHHGHGLAEYFASFRWSMVPISLVGGILSPVAKDLVTALQKVRDV